MQEDNRTEQQLVPAVLLEEGYELDFDADLAYKGIKEYYGLDRERTHSVREVRQDNTSSVG